MDYNLKGLSVYLAMPVQEDVPIQTMVSLFATDAYFRNLGVPSLICMTFPKREQVPSLAALNLGASYWIDGGNLAALA